MHRLSMAIAACEQARAEMKRVLVGTPEERGHAAAGVTLSVIRAQSQMETVLNEMVEAVKEEDAA